MMITERIKKRQRRVKGKHVTGRKRSPQRKQELRNKRSRSRQRKTAPKLGKKSEPHPCSKVRFFITHP